MKSLGILWNSVGNLKDDVINDIRKNAVVLDTVDIDLGNRYEEFVRKIYSVDDIADWRVDKKVETMFLSSDLRRVTVVLLDISTSDTYFHPYKKRIVFTNMENLKTGIREKYSKLIPVYFFDNVFHMTDDENEFKSDYEIINSYLNELGQKKKVLSLKPYNGGHNVK